MDYRLISARSDDWEDDLVVRLEDDDQLTKHGPEESETHLGRIMGEGHPLLFHPSEQFRPSLFDTQFGAVALAADKVWDELTPVMGSVMVKHLQLEKIQIERYASSDRSEIEDGLIIFRVEAEATYPQYRRSVLTIPVKITGGRPTGGLIFKDSKGYVWPLTKEALENHLGVKEWFSLSRVPQTDLALIDRVVHTDWPYYMRSSMTWNIGF